MSLISRGHFGYICALVGTYCMKWAQTLLAVNRKLLLQPQACSLPTFHSQTTANPPTTPVAPIFTACRTSCACAARQAPTSHPSPPRCCWHLTSKSPLAVFVFACCSGKTRTYTMKYGFASEEGVWCRLSVSASIARWAITRDTYSI